MLYMNDAGDKVVKVVEFVDSKATYCWEADATKQEGESESGEEKGEAVTRRGRLGRDLSLKLFVVRETWRTGNDQDHLESIDDGRSASSSKPS